MQKRVLAFLMVIAMVFSLLPVTIVTAEGEEATPGYKMILQKAHNQTEGSLAIDVYLQANTADQGDVTGYQFTVTPAEGLTVTNGEDATGNDNLAGNAKTFIYPPTGETADAIAVGTSRVLVATITVAGDTLPAQVADAITLADVTVTTAAESFVPAVTTLSYACTDHACGHGTGTWTPVTAAELSGKELASGNYYLIQDADISASIKFAQDATVTVCLNGYDITPATSKKAFEITKTGVTFNMCDCTGTGEGADYVSGKLVVNHTWGGAISVNADMAGTVNLYGGTIDGTAKESTDAGAGIYLRGGNNTLYANGVLFVGLEGYKNTNGAWYGANILRGTGTKGTYENCTFVNCGSAILDAPSGTGDAEFAPEMTVKNCVMVDSQEGAYAIDVKHKMFASVTIEGDCQFDVPVYIAEGENPVILNLGENADVTILTEEDKTPETFGEAVTIAEGAALTAGTVIYANVDDFVAYENGVFSFASHAHDGVNFKVWDDSTSLPTEGNWFLNTDVTLTGDMSISAGDELNLDLNGHTIDRKGDTGRTFVYGTLNLYDCAEGYDDAGNWTGGEITGGANVTGPGIYVGRASASAPTNHGVFNMYGGRITGNGANVTGTSGSAVYLGSSLVTTSNGVAVNRQGGEFNMYGGELYANLCGQNGGAVTVYGFSPNGTSSKGVDPTLKMGAVFNMYGGKIHGNVNTNPTIGTDKVTNAEGTVFVTYDGVFNMEGGEISGNTAYRGGAVFASNGATVNISGGTISGNDASKGGAIAAYGSATQVNISGGKITGNTADYGGAVFQQNAKVNISGGEFTGNTVEYSGGAVYTESANAVLTVTGGLFDSNKAEYTGAASSSGSISSGGAFYIYYNATANISNATITNNAAVKNTASSDYSSCGGAVFARDNATVTLTGCTISGNTASNHGAAIAARSTDSVTDDTGKVLRPCTITVKDTTITGNTGKTGMYFLNATTLTLDGAKIYGNTMTGTLSTVYMTKADERLILKGDTVIAGNTNSKTADGGNNQQDLMFQSQAARTELLEVNELAAGAHINLFYGNSTFNTDVTADKVVKITDGGTQTDWDCGWITYYTSSTDAGQNISYLLDESTTEDLTDKYFTFGHYHKDAEGNYYELTAWESTSSLPLGNPEGGVGYYLANDVTISKQKDDAGNYNYSYIADGELNLCFNSKTVQAGAGYSYVAFFMTGTDLTLEDCTASYDTNDHLIAGGKISGFYRTQNGGALYITNSKNADTAGYGSNVSISGIEFEGCHDTKKYAALGTTAWGGGAIQSRYSTCSLTIDGCKFTGNYSETEGGAILTRASAGVSVKNTVFDGNHAGRYGGAIAIFGASANRPELYLENCKFVDNYVTTNPTALTDNAETTDVDESKVATANSSLGGAIYTSYTDLTILDCEFTGNQAINREGLTTDGIDIGMGGAIYVRDSSNIDMDNTNFTGNSAVYQGGAVYVRDGVHTIDGAIFDGNSVQDGYGGAFFSFSSSSNVTMTGTAEKPVVFSNNAANAGDNKLGYGGAYDVMNGTVTMTGAEFYNNSARIGGALRIGGGSGTSVVTANNCIFDGNTADDGGAIYHNSDTATITGGKITNSTAESGAAIRVNGTSELTVDGTEISNNSASTDGGAFAIYGSSSGAPTVNISDATIKDNYGKNGGVIVTHSNSLTKTVEGETVTTNYQPTINVTGTEITGNSASTAAVLYSGMSSGSGTSRKAYNGANVLFDNCTITGNHASVVSVATLTNATDVILRDTTVTGNWMTNGYGALNYNSSTSRFFVEGKTTVYDNTLGENSGVQFNVYMRDFGSNAVSVYVDTANGKALDPSAKIGVTLEGANTRTNFYVTNEGTAQYLANFVADKDTHQIVTIDGADRLYIAQAMYGTSIYPTAQKAIDAINAAVTADATASTELVLLGSVKADLTSTTDLFIDLEGKSIQKLTMNEGTKVTLIDSETNDYDVADGVYGTVVVVGDYETYVEDTSSSSLRRYVVIKADDGTVSAHRVYLAINSKVLRTHNEGLGFGAIYAGDQVVAEAINAGKMSFGIQLSGYANMTNPETQQEEYLTGEFADFTAGTEGTDGKPNQRTAVVTGVLATDAESEEDLYTKPLYGRPYIAIGEDVVATGTPINTTMEEMVAEGLASAFADAVKAMLDKYGITY